MDPSMEEGDGRGDRPAWCPRRRSREILISRLSSHLVSIELLFLLDSLVLIARYLSYCETRTPHARSLPLLLLLCLDLYIQPSFSGCTLEHLELTRRKHMSFRQSLAQCGHLL